MNTDILAGMWKQIQGEVKKQWGKLTDDDIMIIQGQQDKLVGAVQERYGYTRDEAQREVDRFLQKYSTPTR